MQAANQQTGTTTLQLVLAWGLVGIPLALGVLQTLINAMRLFYQQPSFDGRCGGFGRRASSSRLSAPPPHALD